MLTRFSPSGCATPIYKCAGTSKGDEPQRAVIVTWLFTNIFAYFGGNSVNGIADIVTDFFLTAYALVNFSQAMLELSKVCANPVEYTFFLKLEFEMRLSLR